MTTSIYGLSQLYQVNIIHSVRLGTSAAIYVDAIDVAVVLSTALIGVFVTSANIDKFLVYFYHLNQVSVATF